MKKIRVTKIVNFEMAHSLYNHDGECKNIHGHSYKLFVTVIGNILEKEDNPKNGMIMDFSCLKKLIKESIIDEFDHSFLVNLNSPHSKIINILRENNFKIIEVDYQTTCENIICDFAERIQKKLPKEVSLFSLKLHETQNSYAEWYKSDNE